MTTTSTARSTIGTMPASTTHWCTATARIPTVDLKDTTPMWSAWSSTSSYKASDAKEISPPSRDAEVLDRDCRSRDGLHTRGGLHVGCRRRGYGVTLHRASPYRADPWRCSGGRAAKRPVPLLAWPGARGGGH